MHVNTTRRPRTAHGGHVSRACWQRSPLPGQALVIFALFSLVLVGALALSVDAGFLLSERRQVQAAADSAALAAARAAVDDKSGSEIIGTGQSYGSFNAGVAAGNVTVSRPPTSGAHAGDSSYIQVTITKNVQKYFIGAIYSGDWSVTASAVAGIEPDQFDAAILALNSSAGGIRTSGNTTIRAIDGSIMSNYDLNTSGNTTIRADGWVNANDGYHTSGNTTIDGIQGENSHAPEIPDPFLPILSPPSLPAFPGNPVPTVSPGAIGCRAYPGSPSVTNVSPGLRSSGGASCINLNGNVPAITFDAGSWRFTNNAAVSITGNVTGVTFTAGSTWNFVGGNGVSGSGNLNTVSFGNGNYSFTGGADIGLSGNLSNVVIGGGNWYFGGGGGLSFQGNTNVTIYPGTYIFDGGSGFSMGGNSRLTFSAGNYAFFFRNGADFSFNGNARIALSGSVYSWNYFYAGSDLLMNGNTGFTMPSGEYYFDQGTLQNNGNTLIRGDDVFLYFKGPNSYISSTGNASWSFSAPTTTIYAGYVPGVFIYSDRANTSTFTWNGNTSAASTGAIYIPSGQLTMNGNSNGKVLDGQLIIDRLYVTGNNNTQVQYHEYVSADTPKVYLVE